MALSILKAHPVTQGYQTDDQQYKQRFEHDKKNPVLFRRGKSPEPLIYDFYLVFHRDSDRFTGASGNPIHDSLPVMATNAIDRHEL